MSKLCCLVNPHVKCGLCGECWCKDHWTMIPRPHHRVCYCPKKRRRVHVNIRSGIPYILTEEQ